MKKEITFDDIEKFSHAFDENPKNKLALDSVTQSGIASTALNRDVVNRSTHVYSHCIETPEATEQGNTGRCWLFAGLNALRLAAIKNMNMKMKNFELSEPYAMFWDKLEKANYFLETIIETRDEPLDGRLLHSLLSDPLPDGGQWNMFVNIIKKYGIVPKTAMPETFNSRNSDPMNNILIKKLREFAKELRRIYEIENSVDSMREEKNDMMKDIYKMIAIHLGRPPSSFTWEWEDKRKRFHRYKNITPRKFFHQFVGFDLDDMVCLINAPTRDKPFNKLYTVKYLGNVVNGDIIKYLNVDMEIMKKAAVDMIVHKKPVWFGCDVGKMLEYNSGILDTEIYEHELVYGVKFKSSKADRLDYGHSRMTHAMVFTGVNLSGTKPLKWRIENSWGTEYGDKGYMMMTNKWFEEFVFEVVVSKRFLPRSLLPVLKTKPVVLDPWDPMGSLAKSA